jgi:hypothetical protein
MLKPKRISEEHHAPQYVEMTDMREGMKRSSASSGFSTQRDARISTFAAHKDYIAAQGDVYTVGMTVFMLGFVVVSAGLLGKDPTAVSFLLGGVLQTAGGTFTLVTVNLDVPLYLRQKKTRAAAFALLWILSNILYMLYVRGPGFIILDYILVLPSVPMLYLFLRFSSTLDLKPGCPTFLDLLILSFGLYLCAAGVGAVSNIQSLVNYSWLGILQVFSNFFGAACVWFLYKICQWRGQDSSSAAQLAMLAFLFLYGINVLLTQLQIVFEFHGTAKEYPTLLSPAAWFVGPMHFIFPPLMFWLRRRMLGWLGKQWLLKRLRDQGKGFSLIEKGSGDLPKVESAIASGIDLDACLSTAEYSTDSYPILVLAAGNGHVAAVRRLLEAHCDVNAVSKEQHQSALYVAAHNGQVEVCQCLLENGADQNMEDRRGRTPLLISCVSGKLDCVQLLLDHGAEASEEAVLVAAGNGHHPIVAALVAAGVEVRAEESYYLSVDDAYSMYEQRQKNAFHGSLFTAGFVIFALAEWVYLYGWAVFVSPYNAARLNPGDINDPIWAIGQTIGLLMMTAADIDINNFLRQNQVRLVVVLLTWGAYYAFLAAFLLFEQHHIGSGIASYLYAIVVLPFLYIAGSFKKIVEMNAGQRTLTELFTLILALDLFSQIGMHFFTGE